MATRPSLIEHDDGLSRCSWCGTRSDLCAPITTRNGACRNGIRAHCSRSCCSTASRPGFPGSPSCASARRSAPPSTGSIPRRSRATTPKKLDKLMQNAGIVRNRAKIEASVSNAKAYLAIPDFSSYLVGFRRRRADPEPVQDDRPCAGGNAYRRGHLEGPAASAASISAGRPSSMPSCRLADWSTIIWSAATAMMRWRLSPSGADGARPSSAARLAAHAVGTAARSSRSLAARHRDRGHRAWAGARGALERPDQGAACLLGGAAFAAGRESLRSCSIPHSIAAARLRRFSMMRRNM